MKQYFTKHSAGMATNYTIETDGKTCKKLYYRNNTLITEAQYNEEIKQFKDAPVRTINPERNDREAK